jgi:hypothetical protein
MVLTDAFGILGLVKDFKTNELTLWGKVSFVSALSS